MSNSLDILAKHRDALLLAEVGAWLHMFGKLHEQFLEGNHDLDREIPKDVPAELSQILGDGKWTGDIWNELPIPSTNLGAAGLSIYNMIEGHRPLKSESAGFIQLMADAHGRGSGIEKGILDRFALGQEIDVYLSTSLGYEPDATIDRDKLRQERNTLYKFLRQQLALLKKENAKLSDDEWITFRNTFIQQILLSFSGTVAETRRPLNDVTLFDQTSMSVAFFKAALAQNLLGGWKDPSRKDVAYKYRWRLLRIGLNGLAFWGNAMRVSDLLARKRLIKDTLDKAQTLLEVVYPLGTEIYRDENGSIFVVPDIENLLSKTDSSQSLEDQLQAITSEESTKSLSGETQLSLLLSKETRDTLLFGELAMRILPVPTPQFTWLQEQWKGKERDICPICGSRPQGPGKKALDRKICDICEKRRSDRSKQWIDHPATTIWIDEVADKEGKLALLVGYFGIVDWLSGSAFNTVLSLNPRSQRIFSNETPPQEVDFDLQTLNDAILEGLRPGRRFNKNNLLGKLVRKNHRDGGLESVQNFYDFHVNKDTALGTLPSSRKPELLTLSLLRQNPSPARIRRTWETTKKFWEEVESDLNDTVKEIGTRIVIHGTFLRGRSSWGPPIASHTYELKVDTVNLSIVCTNDGEFLTADNLQRVAILLGAPKEATQNYTNAAQYLFERIRSRNVLEIAEPAGYGRLNQIPGLLEIGTIHQEQHFPYLPAITLVNEPRTFMALVPAQDAWKTLEKIKEKYEKEMGKVRNRLPMIIGAVFADSRTPLPGILNAGRRMLKQPTTDECWIVVEQKLDPSSGEVTLTLKNATRLLSVKVPTRMGDRTTEDVWYPYWCVEKDAAENTPSGRERHIQGVDGKEWVHVRNLEVGDVVHFKPSRFDFELLDTAARRFEISYENGMRRGSSHPARPYYLEELNDFKELWQILSSRLKTTQIHHLIEVIETKRVTWDAKKDDTTFQRMLRDALDNVLWYPRPDQTDLKRLELAALSGQLADVFELYVRILKERTKID